MNALSGKLGSDEDEEDFQGKEKDKFKAVKNKEDLEGIEGENDIEQAGSASEEEDEGS